MLDTANLPVIIPLSLPATVPAAKSQTLRARIGAKSARTPLPDGIRELVISDDQVAGFRLRLFAGSASYEFRGRVKGGDLRRIHLGDAWVMPATVARDAALTARASLRAGVDPVAVVAAAVAAKQAEAKAATDAILAIQTAALTTLKGTFNVAATSYVALFGSGSLPHQGRVPRGRSVTSEAGDVARAVAIWTGRGVASLTVADGHAFVAALGHLAPATRKRTFGAASRVLDHAVSTGIAASNPLGSVKAPKGSVARDRYLFPGELQAVWNACAEAGPYGALIRFLICLPLRISVARHAVWADLDRHACTLTIPAHRLGNKSRTAWTLPVPAIALEVLDALTQGAPDDLIFRGEFGSTVAIGGSAQSRLMTLSGTKLWSPHDLRRTVPTLLGDADAGLDVSAADLWLMHLPSGVAAIYQRSKRVAAMQGVAASWDAVLRKIIAGG